MEYNRNFINENIVNISLMAGQLLADGKISVEDNAELTDHIVALANSFEESHKGIDYNAPVKEGEASPDYWADIDAFAGRRQLWVSSAWRKSRTVCAITLTSTPIPLIRILFLHLLKGCLMSA